MKLSNSGVILHYATLFVKKADDNDVPTGKGISSGYDNTEVEVPQYLQDIEGGRFSFDTFKSLTSPSEMNYYLESLLPPVSGGKGAGEGSGRRVYDFGDKVIKFAYNTPGQVQNQRESEISSKSKYFTDVYEAQPEYYWIVAEKITPFESEDDFESKTKVPKVYIPSITRLMKMDVEALLNLPIPDEGLNFLFEIKNIYNSLKLIAGDLGDYKHWGLSSNGDLKIFDYGLTHDDSKKYYENGAVRPEATDDERERMHQMGIPYEHYDLGVRVISLRINKMLSLAFDQ